MERQWHSWYRPSMLNSVNINTLHYEIFECTFCTLSNNICYILHPNVKFAIDLAENSKLRVQSVIMSIVYGGKV